MVRRTTRTLAVTAVLLLLFPAGALAYSLSTLTVDGDEGTVTVTGSTEHIDIRVGFSATEPRPTALQVRIAGEDDRVTARCHSGDCRSTLGGGAAVFRLPFQAYGGEFSSPTHRIANGDVRLDVVADRATGGSASLGEVIVRMDVPGSAVRSLDATVAGEEVRLSWDAAPEAGLGGYRVERITGERTTEVVDSTSSTSVTDRPGPGEHRYKVETFRPKAGGSGSHVADATVTAVVEEPSNGDGGSNGNGGSNGSNGSNGSSGSNGSDGSNGANGSNGASGSNGAGGGSSTDRADAPEVTDDRSDDSDDEVAAPRTAPREREPRTGEAPDVSTGRGGSGIPELPLVGDVFRGELDFGDEDPDGRDVRADEDDPDEVVVGAPASGWGSFLGASGDEAQRIAIPIAGGLLLTAIGLHLWRWLKVPLP